MANLILVRHGESYLNKKNVYFGKTDSKLTEEGLTQIKNLKNIIPDYDFIYSSPSSRALTSAKIINFKKKEIIIDDLLREIDFGIFEGLSFEEINSVFPKEVSLWKEQGIYYAFPEGESIEELSKRCMLFFEKISSSNDTFVIVTHSGIINALLSIFLTGTIDNFWKFKCNLGSLTEIEISPSFAILKSFSISK